MTMAMTLDQECLNRRTALAEYLGIPVDDLDSLSSDPQIVTWGPREHLVLNAPESRARAEDYVKETLWSVEPSELANWTGLPQEVFEALCPLCTVANEAIWNLLSVRSNPTIFVNSLMAKGLGRILNSVDGTEVRFTSPTTKSDWYIYRVA